MTDPNGNLTIIIHGTFADAERKPKNKAVVTSQEKDDFMPGGPFFETVASTINDTPVVSFQWSGKDNHASRLIAAHDLAARINSYQFSKNERLNLIFHSHGGNVALLAINHGLHRPVDLMVTLGTPSRNGYRLHEPSRIKEWFGLFNSFDHVQVIGGGDYEDPLEGGAAARTHPYAKNINWNVDFGPVGSHTALHSAEAWEFLFPRFKIQRGEARNLARTIW